MSGDKQHQKPEEKNAAAKIYESSNGLYGASMEQQRERAANKAAAEVREQAEWCKLPQSVRDSEAREGERDKSCDVKPKSKVRDKVRH